MALAEISARTPIARCAARLGDVFRLEADLHLDPSRPGDWQASVHSDRTDPSMGLPYETELAILDRSTDCLVIFLREIAFSSAPVADWTVHLRPAPFVAIPHADPGLAEREADLTRRSWTFPACRHLRGVSRHRPLLVLGEVGGDGEVAVTSAWQQLDDYAPFTLLDPDPAVDACLRDAWTSTARPDDAIAPGARFAVLIGPH